MNVDDEIDRRLLHNARELRGVPIEPPPLPAAARRSLRRDGARSLVLATCAVLLAIGGGVAAWGELAPSPTADPTSDGVAAPAVLVPAPATTAPRPQPREQLLDGYDEVAMISRAADEAAAEPRPLPPGVA